MPGEKAQPAGSLKTGGPAFLEAGKIRRPHGVHGELLVEIYTDFPERLNPGKTVFLGDKHTQVKITSQRYHNDGLLLTFAGYDTPEAAGRFRNQIVYVTAVDSPELADGEYYFHELLDLAVVDEQGNTLGLLTEVIETGANDVYVVTTSSGKEILLPAIPEVILNVDLKARTMAVHLLPGLLDEDAEIS